MNNIWNQVFLGNTLRAWIIAIGIIAATFLVLRVARSIVVRRLKKWSQKTDNKFDDFLVLAINKYALPYLYILGMYWGIKSLQLTDKVHKIADVTILVVGTFFIIRLIASAVTYLINVYVGAHLEQDGRKKQARGMIVLIHILIWVIGGVFLIDNLGYNITTIITGLGIGGVAIALASQAILGDLFSYFVIFFDKPFEIGDFIIVGDKLGAVEYIGIKTTRLRSLGGEELIFSNTDLTNSRVHNYKRMERRRIVFSFRVMYGTATDKLNRVPSIVRKAIEAQNNATFDRAHLLGFGEFSLNYEVVYFVKSPDYNVYMDIQQAINIEMIKAFEQEQIRFAYPTQNLIFNNVHESLHAMNEHS